MSEKSTQHEITAEILRVAQELGRVPTRDEFRSLSSISQRQMYKHFDNYSVAVTAAGLTPANQKHRIKSLFNKDISTQIENHKKVEHVKTTSKYEKIVLIGDCHFPFVDLGALCAVYDIIERHKPDIVIQMGDLLDMLSQTKFPRSHNIYTPKDEVELGYKMADDMWRAVKTIVPHATCYQILGNHDIRPLKRILESYPEGEIFFSIEKYFEFEGVTTIKDARQELIINDIAFIHGYKTKLGDHRDEMLMNVCVGHSHTGGVSYRKIGNKILWELNAGYIGDATSKALSYTPIRMTKWTLGCGIIDTDGPRFVPFE